MANIVVLTGRLVADAELRAVGTTTVARFTLAVDKNLSKEKRQEMEMQGKPTADFINCQAWGKMAESLVKYSGKGLRVLINGRIQTGSYEKDGQRIYTTDVTANNIEYIDWKNSNFQNGNNSTVANNETVEEQLDYSSDFDPTEDNRIPF